MRVANPVMSDRVPDQLLKDCPIHIRKLFDLEAALPVVCLPSFAKRAFASLWSSHSQPVPKHDAFEADNVSKPNLIAKTRLFAEKRARSSVYDTDSRSTTHYISAAYQFHDRN